MESFATYYSQFLVVIQNLSDGLTPSTLCDFAAIILALLTAYITFEYFMFYLRRRRTEIKFIRKDSHFIYNERECPICYSNFTKPVVRAPCGHAYCLHCLLTYFTTNSLEWKCVCPLCRGFVTDYIVLEDLGEESYLDPSQIKIRKTKLSKLVKQQNKDIILSKPWPFIKAIVIATPFVILLLLFKYVTPEKGSNINYQQKSESVIQMGGQMIF